MANFISNVLIYLICFVITLCGLSAFDFNHIIKKDRVVQAWILYYVIAFVITYLLGQFMMSIIYYFY